MNFSEHQRQALNDIVTRIEDGAATPKRIPGEIGRFLRELGTLRARVNTFVPSDGKYVRGRALGAIGLTPLAPIQERLASKLVGEVATTIAVSEELAGVFNVSLWSKGRAANRLLNTWLHEPSTAWLAGDYRWYAPRRVTPGTASIEQREQLEIPWTARALRFSAEEFLAAPRAISYRWDAAFGTPDFRTLRVVAAHWSSSAWCVVPASDIRLAERAKLDSATRLDPAPNGLALALVARTPWYEGWSVLESKQVDANDVLAHLITWADHKRELMGESSPTAPEIAQIQAVLSRLGHATSREEGVARATLTRSVLPSVRQLAAWTRGLA